MNEKTTPLQRLAARHGITPEAFQAQLLEDLREDAAELAAEAEEWSVCDQDSATQVEPFEPGSDPARADIAR